MTCTRHQRFWFLFVSFGIHLFPQLLAQGLVPTLDSDKELQSELFCLCQLRGDTLSLRWAPNSTAMVRKGIEHGYVLIRTEYLPNGDSSVSEITFSSKEREDFLMSYASLSNVEAAAALLYEKQKPPVLGTGILENYAQYENQQMNAGMILYMADLDFDLAMALNLGWREKIDEVSHLVKYSISLNGTALSTYIFRNSRKCIPSSKPIDQLFAIPDDQSIALTWDIYYDQSGYIGFYVERSEDSISWSRLNALPIAIVEQGDTEHQHWITYSDSVPENNRSYYYRIQGVTSFGQVGPYSRVLAVEARPPSEINPPYLLGANNIADTSLLLIWSVSGKDSVLVETIAIMSAAHPDSTFVTIATLDGSHRSYVDYPNRLNNYYIIQATDRHGHIYTGSLGHGQLPDKIPPAAPLGVVATADTAGNVNLKWRDNLEADLSGYRVFYKRYMSDEEIQLTTSSIQSTEFVHRVNLKMLNHRILYQISAEDRAGNRSRLSLPIKVLLPDTIAPTRPVLLETKSGADGCILYYTLSGSSDIRWHVLERKFASEGTWMAFDTIRIVSQGRLQSIDSLLIQGDQAEYQLLAIDSSGNTTKSNSLAGRRIDSKIRSAPPLAHYIYRKRKNELKFEWSYAPQETVKAFRIFIRNQESQKFQTYKYINPTDIVHVSRSNDLNKYSYVVANVQEQKVTDFKIRVDFEGGAISESTTFVRRKQ